MHAGTTSTKVAHTGRSGFSVDWELVRQILLDLPTSEPNPSSGPRGLPWSSADRPTATWDTVPSFWDHDAVHAWFVAHVRVPPTGEFPVTTRDLFGERTRQRRGWMFHGGSTLVHPKHGRPESIAVLKNGRRVYPGVNSWLKAGELGDGYNARALADMAALTELTVLPRAPERPEAR